MRAEIVAIGSELLTPSRLDTNSLLITRSLNALGIRVMRKSVVGDHRGEIQEVLESALSRSDIVILMGGLGPTNDDITRQEVAQALGRSLLLDEKVLEALERSYGRLGLKMTENNRRQAVVIEGSTVLSNPVGTAPGLFLKERETLIFLLPGPPRELQPMISSQVIPLIQRYKQTSRQYHRQLKVASQAESRVDAMIESIYQRFPDVETTILASAGIIEVYFNWQGEADEELANRQLEELCRRVRERLGVAVFTEAEETLEAVVGQRLRSLERTVATAESCTGGLVGKMLTDVSGSSEYYLGGVVAYGNSWKVQWLGVNETTLERFGAVSEPVAYAMALGVRLRTGADYGLSLTGIAGPEGGTEEKPVGTVFVGLSGAEGTVVKKFQLRGDRETIRLRAARLALDWLRLQLAADH